MLLFIFLLPAIQVIFFCIAIGQKPTGLRLGIVNYEADMDMCSYPNISTVTECDLTLFSCKMFKSDDIVDLVSYESESEAETDVQNGNIWGYLSVPDNFTSSLISKYTGSEQRATRHFRGIGS